MAISVIQTGTAGTNSGTMSFAFSAVTANNLVVFNITGPGGTFAITSVNDDKGNTYQQAVGTASAAQSAHVFQWYGINTTGGATKGTAIYNTTAACNGNMLEISGISTTSPLVGTSTGTQTGTVLSVTSFTPSVGSSIVISSGRIGGAQAWTVGAGFTIGGTSSQMVSQYDVFTSGSATIADCHGTQAAAWAAVAGAYKAGGGAGTNLIQSSGTANLAAGSTLVTFPSNMTAGNLVVVGVTLSNAASLGTVSSVTDSQNNTYSLAKRGTLSEATSVIDEEIWYAANITSGTGIITVNHTTDNCAIYAREYSGFNTLDVTNSATGSSTTPNTGTVTTTVATELLVVSTGDDKGATQTFTAAGNYGDMVGTTATLTDISMEDNLVTSTGAQTGTLTLGAAANWVSTFASFYNQSAGGIGYRNLLGIGR